jgi:hypothetical protein
LLLPASGIDIQEEQPVGGALLSFTSLAFPCNPCTLTDITAGHNNFH